MVLDMMAFTLNVIYCILNCNDTIEKGSGEYGEVRGAGEGRKGILLGVTQPSHGLMH